MSVIDIQGITKLYGHGKNQTEILHGIQLAIGSGEFVAITGPSGSGKSTLMNILGLLDVPDEGDYILNNIDISNTSDAKLTTVRLQQIGFVFQSFNLIPNLNVRDNVELPMIYNKVSLKQRRQRSKQLLEMVGLGDMLRRHPNQLSGGQQQRVAIARALANQPALILADEPTGNLDTVSGKAIMDLLHSLNTQGVTVVMVTHDPGLAQQTGRVITIRDGLKVYDSNAILSPVVVGSMTEPPQQQTNQPSQSTQISPQTIPAPQPLARSSRLLTIDEVIKLQQRFSREPTHSVQPVAESTFQAAPQPISPIPTAPSKVPASPSVNTARHLPMLANDDIYTPIPITPVKSHPNATSKTSVNSDGSVSIAIQHEEEKGQ